MAEYLAWAEVRIEALNRALQGMQEDRVRMHMYFGSQNVPHTIDPALRGIVGLLLKARVQGYPIEASNPRHEHEWFIWRDVKLPADKVLMPKVGHATNIPRSLPCASATLRDSSAAKTSSSVPNAAS